MGVARVSRVEADDQHGNNPWRRLLRRYVGFDRVFYLPCISSKFSKVFSRNSETEEEDNRG